jgi:GTP-binding protein
MAEIQPSIRNIAIIAHVDHGKTTLVDGMLRQTKVFGEHQELQERVLDSNDLERERGITILAKNTGIEYEGVAINIVDTPGHADFGSEVERILNMVDGVLLLVDAVEGPMPQTRFVLRHALKQGLKPIVVVNKVDRPASRIDAVVNETFDLFIDLGATDEQADFPVVYAIATEGRAGLDPLDLKADLRPLFDTILEAIPPPEVDLDGPPQLLVTTLEYSNYVGKIAVGRLRSGSLKTGQAVAHCRADGKMVRSKISEVFTFRDLKRNAQPSVHAGNIVAVSGILDVGIGDTITDLDDPRPLPPIRIEEPTVRMTFSVNDSPFSGRSGKFMTSRQLRARFDRELESNVALRVEDTARASDFLVSGRGELHLAILIETMRREGYEFSVSQPEVIFREGENGLQEPVDEVFLEIPSEYLGPISEMMGKRKARLQETRYGEDGTLYNTYFVPTRGMLGFRQPFLTSTRGTGVFHTLFHAYEKHQGEIDAQPHGSLVSLEMGSISTYALQSLEQRGTFFLKPGDETYAGQVVGQHIRDDDLVVNVCKTKHITNHRSSTKDVLETMRAPRNLSLDDAIDYLGSDELLEVTPVALRLRKRVLDHNNREKAEKNNKR